MTLAAALLLAPIWLFGVFWLVRVAEIVTSGRAENSAHAIAVFTLGIYQTHTKRKQRMPAKRVARAVLARKDAGNPWRKSVSVKSVNKIKK